MERLRSGERGEYSAGIASVRKLETGRWRDHYQRVGLLDGTGGFVAIETDNPMDLLDGPQKFGVIAEYQVYPVADFADVAQAFQEGVTFQESIGSATPAPPERDERTTGNDLGTRRKYDHSA
ncbi:DUF3303 domain-containing protein [Nocardia grenadensis]